MVAPNVTSRVIDRSFGTPRSGAAVSGIVIHSDRGPTEITQVTSVDRFVQLYGEPKSNRPTMYSVIQILKDSSRVKVLRVVDDAAAATVDIEEGADTTFTINAANPGAWGNNISVTFGKGGSDTDLFDLNVFFNGDPVETYRVSKLDDKKDGFGNSVYIEDAINGNSDYIEIDDNPSVSTKPETLIDSGDETDLTGGSNDSATPSDGDIATAWDEFNNTADVNVDFLVNGGWANSTVQTKMIEIAQTRGDCFAFLDVPEADDSVSAMVDYVDPQSADLNANTSFAAVYGHWVRQYDEFNDREINVAPSAVAAGVATRSRAQDEIWAAPAGVRRGRVNAIGVTNVFNGAELDTLYENNINPITQLPGQGLVVWGQKTLQRTASALDRINVRFVVTHIQNVLREALVPFIFQGNTEFERENITALADGFLEDIQTRQGLFDFRVICDESNNTPEVIDRNELIVDVFIKPTRTAEFIKLNVILTPTGVDFN